MSTLFASTALGWENEDLENILNELQEQFLAEGHFDGTLTVGDDGYGNDVTFHGATSGCSLVYDASENQLVLTGSASVPALKLAGDGSLGDAAVFAALGTPWVDGGTPAFVPDQNYLRLDVGGTVYRIPLWADA